MGGDWGADGGDIKEAHNKGIRRQDSFSSQASSQDIPLLLPQEAGQNGDRNTNGLDMTHDPHGHQMKIIRSMPNPFRKAKIEPVASDMPMKTFVDDFDSVDGAAPVSMKSSDEWWETQERGSLVVPPDETGQVGPCVSCRCQVSCKRKILSLVTCLVYIIKHLNGQIPFLKESITDTILLFLHYL